MTRQSEPRGASVPGESVALECGRRHSGGGLIRGRSVVRGRGEKRRQISRDGAGQTAPVMRN